MLTSVTFVDFVMLVGFLLPTLFCWFHFLLFSAAMFDDFHSDRYEYRLVAARFTYTNNTDELQNYQYGGQKQGLTRYKRVTCPVPGGD